LPANYLLEEEILNKLQQDIKWLLRTFDRMHKNCIDAELKERGLSEVSHPLILFVLHEELKDMTASQKEIGDAIGICPSTVAISVKRMEKSGLVRKVTNEYDLRCNDITLTEKGIKSFEECSTAIDKIDKNLLNGFSKEEHDQLKKFYVRMIENLESMGAKAPSHLLNKMENQCKK
jgi:DNA-binding MarR family transcriptional regulator